MSQNKTKLRWKSVVAAAFIMAILIAMATAVSAGFVEFIFGEECDEAMFTMATSTHTHTPACWESVEAKVPCTQVTSGLPYCTGGYTNCWGGNYGHGTTETWQQLICGNP